MDNYFRAAMDCYRALCDPMQYFLTSTGRAGCYVRKDKFDQRLASARSFAPRTRLVGPDRPSRVTVPQLEPGAIGRLREARSAGRHRPPGASGHPPVDPFQQITELPRRDRHDTLGRRRPDEPTVLQPLHEEARPLGVVLENLDQVTAAAAKDEKMAGARIALEHLLDLEREPVHALAHVGAAGGQPDPRPARERDHRPASARS